MDYDKDNFYDSFEDDKNNSNTQQIEYEMNYEEVEELLDEDENRELDLDEDDSDDEYQNYKDYNNYLEEGGFVVGIKNKYVKGNFATSILTSEEKTKEKGKRIFQINSILEQDEFKFFSEIEKSIFFDKINKTKNIQFMNPMMVVASLVFVIHDFTFDKNTIQLFRKKFCKDYSLNTFLRYLRFFKG